MNRRRLLRYLLALSIACVLFVAIKHRRDFWDFEVYRTAGVRIMSAQSLYRPEDGHYQFKYWPAFALAMIPFALLPLYVATLIWFVLSIALLWVYVNRAIAVLPDRLSSERWLFWWTLAISTKFLVKELVNGQTNVLMALLVFTAIVTAEQGRAVRAGVLIGLAVFVKPYALIALPWLAVTVGLGGTAIAGAVIAIGLLLPAVVYGWSGNLAQLQAWYAGVTQTTAPNLFFPENISFASMWARWIGAGPAATRLAAVTSLVALAAAILVWWRRRRVEQPAYLEAGVLLLLMPLLSPQGWDYVLIVAIPAYICLMDRFSRLSLTWRALAATAIGLTSFTIFDLIGRRAYVGLMSVSAVAVGGLLMVAVLTHLRLRRLA